MAQQVGYDPDVWECFLVASQYPVCVPWAMYATKHGSAKLQRCRFIQFYIDAVFAIRKVGAEGVRLVVSEHKTLMETTPSNLANILNDMDPVKQASFNAWAFQHQAGLHVAHCAIVSFSRRTGVDMFASVSTFQPNTQEFDSLYERFIFSPGAKPTGDVAPTMIVFDENHYGVFLKPKLDDFKKIGTALTKHRLFVRGGEVQDTGPMGAVAEVVDQVHPHKLTYGMLAPDTELLEESELPTPVTCSYALYVGRHPREDGYQLHAQRDSAPIGPPPEQEAPEGEEEEGGAPPVVGTPGGGHCLPPCSPLALGTVPAPHAPLAFPER